MTGAAAIPLLRLPRHAAADGRLERLVRCLRSDEHEQTALLHRRGTRTPSLAGPALDDLEISPDLYRWHPFNRQMYFGGRVMLPGHLLASKGDRVAMHSSVETRYAFLDEDVIAYMAKLHPRWKLRGVMKDKFVERKVAERWLPKEVAWRRKKMFRAPMDTWAKVVGTERNPREDWIDQVLSEESIRKAGYFDPAAVATARAETREARSRSGAY